LIKWSRFTAHALRHAFATHHLDKRSAVSELMDHSSVDIMKRFYGHISGERLDKTINLLDLNTERRNSGAF
jgi:integrase